ncbi:hypothetical protein CLCR_02937 [Cladophialophora carrionii]|uniref:Uncharacterized protein n=1 Tax=Cladophialophora carrionii TaxID=86049 RepID=A0A1C1D1V8_9EURO|nr:hypothetical protein CLCR_02937 [Cladophialophora carrionii]
MSTAVAPAVVAPLPPLDRNPSPRSYPPLAPSINATPVSRSSEFMTTPEATNGMNVNERASGDGKRSPRSRSGGNPKIVVKKEPPASPSLQPSTRHRPKKLDLNTNTSISNGLNSRPSATPLTARDGLVLHDVGLACLSPGFQTQDPAMREQLERSISVRDQQRSIIQARLLKSARGDGPDSGKTSETAGPTSGKMIAASSKKRPPPGLSIVPPAAERFANERVIQSAPLNQTFTGRHEPPPHSRQLNNQPPANTQHANISHMPAIQTNNRLPPIADVFGPNELNSGAARPPFLHANSTPSQMHGPPLPSPGFPPQTAHPTSQPQPPSFDRPRDYRSAEEAVHEMTGGREDLLPKIVHYGGHQPPTPPSPHPGHRDNLTPHKYQANHHPTSRRRSRNEYEDGSSPPLGSGPDRIRYHGPFGEGRDSPATQRAKKEEFLSLCSRAWDLFHS